MKGKISGKSKLLIQGFNLKLHNMNKQKYEDLLNNHNIIKYARDQGHSYLHLETNTVIHFSYFYYRFQHYLDKIEEKRIIFKAYPFRKYQGNPLPLIESEQCFLVNSGDPNLAKLFKITIDKESRTAKLSLDEYPEFIDSLIDEDKRVIELQLED